MEDNTINIPPNYRRLLDDAEALAAKLKASEPVPLELMSRCPWENSETLSAAKKHLVGLQSRREGVRKAFEKNIESMREYAGGCVRVDEVCA